MAHNTRMGLALPDLPTLEDVHRSDLVRLVRLVRTFFPPGRSSAGGSFKPLFGLNGRICGDMRGQDGVDPKLETLKIETHCSEWRFGWQLPVFSVWNLGLPRRSGS